MKNRKTIILIISLISVVLVFALVTFKPYAQDRNINKLQTDVPEGAPAVNYFNQEPEDEKRKAKSEKYNKAPDILPSDTDILMDGEGVWGLHWEQGLTALPVDKSEVVILGKVVDAKAFLSGNKNHVYSEFKIEIENVFKNSSKHELEDGKYLRAERSGGIVRYPSGHTYGFWVMSQRMPRVDRIYVFFLTSDFPDSGHHQKDLYLLTGYELRNGKVFPLDNPDDRHPIVSTYQGKDESILLNDLRNSLGAQ